MKQMKHPRTGRVLRIAALSVATAAALNAVTAYADNNPVDLNVHIAIVMPNKCTAVVTPATDNAYTLGYDITNTVGHFTTNDLSTADTRLTKVEVSGGSTCTGANLVVDIHPLNALAPPGTVADGGSTYIPTGSGAYWLGAMNLVYARFSDDDGTDQSSHIVSSAPSAQSVPIQTTPASLTKAGAGWAANEFGSTMVNKSCGTSTGQAGCFGYGRGDLWSDANKVAIMNQSGGLSAKTGYTGHAGRIFAENSTNPAGKAIRTVLLGVAGYFGSNPVNAAGQSALEAVPNGTVITQQYQLDITLV